MLGTTQESQNKLGKFNQEQWNQFVEDTIKKEGDEELKTAWDQFVEKLTQKEEDALEAVKEQSKKNKKKNIEILEKHFHDRTLQPMSEFNKTGEKEAGYSSGFQAEHEYSESDKATFMIKSVLNHTLTEEEKQSRLAQFKKSFYEGSRKATKWQNPYSLSFMINNFIDLLSQIWEKNPGLEVHPFKNII